MFQTAADLNRVGVRVGCMGLLDARCLSEELLSWRILDGVCLGGFCSNLLLRLARKWGPYDIVHRY